MTLNLLKQNDFSNLNRLNWLELTEKICQFAHFDKTKKQLKAPPRSLSLEEINLQYSLIEKVIRTKEHLENSILKKLYQIPSNTDIIEDFLLIEKGGVLGLEAFYSIKRVIETYLINPRFFKEVFDLELHKESYNGIKKIASSIDQLVLEDGGLNTRHPQILKISEAIAKLEAKCREEISKRKYSYDIFNSRHLIIVESDQYSTQLGKISHRSKKGHFLFIEPIFLKDMNDKLEELYIQQSQIVFQISKETSEKVASELKSIQRIYEKSFEADILIAKSFFSTKENYVRPKVSLNSKMEIKNFFHPLIEDAITNSIKLDDKKVFVISGPNAGGKSVLLKTLSLILIFPHLGLYVPADYADIPYSRNIFLISHDNQSIDMGLSSFAAEATEVLHVFEHTQKHDSFVFIDEIFNSTSSDEASFLALNLIEKFLSFSSKLFLTTHHNLLKYELYKKENILSAHMEFSHESKTPTFKLNQNGPGSSFASEIFLNIIEKDFNNLQYLKKEIESHQGSFNSFEKELTQLNKLNQELRLQKEETLSLNKSLKDREHANQGIMELDRKNALIDLQNDLSKIKNEAYDYLEKVKRGELKTQKKIAENFSKIQTVLQVEPEKKQTTSNIADLKKGDRVKVFNLTETLTILELKKDKLLVSKGPIKLWIKRNQVKMLIRDKFQKTYTANSFIPSDTSLELDARGMRLDSFKSKSEEKIYQVVNQEIPHLNIIHGHGDGVLKNWLRIFLKGFSDVSWESPNGNDGSTFITLK